ncbi:MAG: hypothetical protein ACKVOK_10640 [Flavobacteriales bacterium]
MTTTTPFRLYKLIAFTVAIVLAAGCKKEAGEGGNSTIFGKVNKDIRVVLTNPATTQSTVIAADRDVYIVYGDHTSPGDRIQSNYNGEFEFRNLRPGNYTIYTFSKDTNAVAVPWDEDHMPITLSLEISEKKQDVDAGTLTIYDVE